MITEERKKISLKVGGNLKKIRIEKNISIKELALLLNVCQKTILSWENGKTLPKTNKLIIIAKMYNMRLDDILGLNKIEENIVEN